MPRSIKFNLPHKVVGHNNHLKQDPYDHYDLEMKKAASGFSPLIYVDRKAGKPLYSQVYDAFRAAIVGGNLRAGQRIPSTRALSSELRISRIRYLTRMLSFWRKAILRAAQVREHSCPVPC